jgi:guanylate kinase
MSVLKDEFLEHVEYNNHLYGTSKHALDFVLKREKENALLILDTKGMFRLKSYCKSQGYQCLTIWLETPQISNMITHMRVRKTPADEILDRLIIWEQEATHKNKYDLVLTATDPEDASKKIKNELLNKYGK